MASKPRTEPGAASASSFRWWQGIIVGLLLAYVPGSLLMVGVFLLPLLVLRLVDPDADTQRLVIVLFYIGAVMVRPAHEIWLDHGTWVSCMTQITNPVTIVLDWIAAATAWLVAEVSAIGGRMWSAEVSKRERRAIEKRIDYLTLEWITPDDENMPKA